MDGSGMTLITTVLIGAGAVFIASALDDSSIVQTFQKIMNGETLSVATTSTTSTTTQTSTGTTPPSSGLPPGTPTYKM